MKRHTKKKCFIFIDVKMTQNSHKTPCSSYQTLNHSVYQNRKSTLKFIGIYKGIQIFKTILKNKSKAVALCFLISKPREQ